MSSLLAKSRSDKTGWVDRHNKAVMRPVGMETGLVLMLQGWERYAADMLKLHGTKVGNDGYCGEYWEDIGKALIKLLSGPTGKRLDGGTVDRFVRECAEEFDADLE